MGNSRSKKSLYREAKRKSETVNAFREKVECFLDATKASEAVAYSIKKDLSAKTDMEFYGQNKKQCVKCGSDIDMAVEYIELLHKYGDLSFAKQLLKKLGVQQNQVLRRLARRTQADKQLAKRTKLEGRAGGIWEHAIPTKYVISEINKMLSLGDIKLARQLLERYEAAGQKFLSKKDEQAVSLHYRDTMPEKWDWKSTDCDLKARYKAAGIKIAK